MHPLWMLLKLILGTAIALLLKWSNNRYKKLETKDQMEVDETQNYAKNLGVDE